MIRRATPLLAVLLITTPEAALAQRPPAAAEWRTLSTEHFDLHYPAGLSAWARRATTRLEAIHEAVTSLVGNEPTRRVDVLVHDPYGLANGFAGPGPLVVLWPNPPDPTSVIGEHRGWSEFLSVHEVAHVAHLDWPSRNPRERWLWRWIPIPGHAIGVKTPRWAREGFATWVEGRVTGSGRPHGAWRPAVLRQWALEGRLPSYRGLNGGDGFLAEAMAYLVGSAFLEWLVERAGEESLIHLWQRLTARERRGFDEAFAGVFGGPPSELYGRFTAEVTARAIEAERRIEVAPGGRVEGAPFQRLAGATGAPAVSPDGEHVAVVVAPPDRPSRLVVWSTAPDTTTAGERARRERARELDPEDVPAVEWRPDPREPRATLWPAGGRAHRAPRFLPDGRLLVVRMEGVGGGRARSDVFVWDWRRGELARVTRGAGIREADPAPDGETAVGSRCAAGRCDVVRIDLATGALETIAAGGFGRSYAGPRISPDGTTVVAAVRVGGRWRLEAMRPDGTERRFVDPDDGISRFDPAFVDGDAFLAVSDRDGIFDLERIELDSGRVEPVTRTTGAVRAPAPAPDGSAYFLVLRSRGWQLHRLPADAARPEGRVELDRGLAPAVRIPPVELEALPAAPVPEGRAYGLGPRAVTPWPHGFGAEEGWGVGGAVVGSDPVGRLSWSGHAVWGSESSWRGGGGAIEWRGWGPRVFAEGFAFSHRPSEQDDPPRVGSLLDVDLIGASTGIELERDRLSRRATLRLGGSVARLDRAGVPGTTRSLVHASGGLAGLHTPRRWRWSGAIGVAGSAGWTDGEAWGRVRATGRLRVGRAGRALRLEGRAGLAGEETPPFERFAVGGVTPPLAEGFPLAQRLAMPALPAATLVGRRALVVEAALETGPGLAPFVRAARGGPGFDRWVRVVGLESSFDAPAIPYFRVPGVRARVGVGRVLDGPNEDELRAWGWIRVLP